MKIGNINYKGIYVDLTQEGSNYIIKYDSFIFISTYQKEVEALFYKKVDFDKR